MSFLCIFVYARPRHDIKYAYVRNKPLIFMKAQVRHMGMTNGSGISIVDVSSMY